jgi:hypothetical protein
MRPTDSKHSTQRGLNPRKLSGERTGANLSDSVGISQELRRVGSMLKQQTSKLRFESA